MMDECERLVRVVRLRDDLKPVQIFMGEPPQAISPDWVGITHVRWTEECRTEPHDSFDLSFRRDDGSEITWEQFETLRIALDQAKAIVGVKEEEWKTVSIEMTEDGWPWNKIEKELSNQASEVTARKLAEPQG
jgi:hypothetical protein